MKMMLFVASGQLVCALTPPAGTVVFGSGAVELQLLSGKLAARAGFKSSIVAPKGADQQWRRNSEMSDPNPRT